MAASKNPSDMRVKVASEYRTPRLTMKRYETPLNSRTVWFSVKTGDLAKGFSDHPATIPTGVRKLFV
jgi:hypothetical protein